MLPMMQLKWPRVHNIKALAACIQSNLSSINDILYKLINQKPISLASNTKIANVLNA